MNWRRSNRVFATRLRKAVCDTFASAVANPTVQSILKGFSIAFGRFTVHLRRAVYDALAPVVTNPTVQSILKRFSIAFGFLLLLILLVANATFTRRRLDVQTDDQTWAAHTQQILFQVSQTQLLVADAETAQHAYINTGDRNQLAIYDMAVAQLEPHIEQLAQLTADTTREHTKDATLRTLVEETMSMLSQANLMYQSGYPEVAKQIVASERTRHLTATVGELLGEIAKDETSLQAARSATYQSSVERTIDSIYLSTGIVGLGLIFLARYISRQIDLRDRHARQILEREEWFRSVLNSLGDAVVATDKQGRITFLNPTAERFTGIELSRAKGQPVDAVFPIFSESTRQPVASSVKTAAEAVQTIAPTHDTVLQRSDGHLIPITDNAAPILDSRDKLVGEVHVFRDATYERYSRGILSKVEKLEASARFAETASREINTPLTAVGDLIYVVKLRGGVPTDSSELLTMAQEELARATHITREIFGLYRDPNPPKQVDLSDLVDSVLRSFSSKFREKNIRIERDLQDCPSINGYLRDLNQAIANLVMNAVDAVPYGGTIWVELSHHDDAEGNAVLISVQDDGPGIAPEHKDRVFQPFFTTKTDGSYGLGLWVAKGIVERHGGSIQLYFENEATSPRTVFSILLPVDAVLQSSTQAA
jgi:PAS domain S-box-containing protein